MEDQILKLIQDIGNNGKTLVRAGVVGVGYFGFVAFITLLERLPFAGGLRFNLLRCRRKNGKPFVLLPGCWKRKWWKRHPKYGASK